jgi:ribosomal protein S18 acetylase RimI-like enzyme
VADVEPVPGRIGKHHQHVVLIAGPILSVQVHLRDRFGEELRIIDLALLPEFRGRGVATSLLGSLIREAAGLGLPLRIHVERFNPALRLYERLGFRLVADRGVYLFLERPPDGKAATAGDETHMGGRA